MDEPQNSGNFKECLKRFARSAINVGFENTYPWVVGFEQKMLVLLLLGIKVHVFLFEASLHRPISKHI